MESMQTIFTIVNSILSLTVLGLIIRFSVMMRSAFSMMKDALKEKEDGLKQRIETLKEELEKTEKWAKRNEEELIKEKNVIEKQLNTVLSEVNIDLRSRDIREAVKNVDENLKISIKEITEKIENLKLEKTNNDIEFNLSLAEAFAANGEWSKSAEQFEIVTKIKSTSWELYFSQGVAFANSRLDGISNLKSLQSYISAIIFLPKNIDTNTRARIYIYLGAMLKRLNKLEEAEFNIKIGLKYAQDKYEINDGLYNLACVYAMQNNKKEYLEAEEKLKSNSIKKYHYLQSRLSEYAPNFDKN